MKKCTLLIILFFLNYACTNKENTPKIESELFMNSLVKETTQKSIKHIDSILIHQNNQHSHLALLYYRKGILLSKLQKDKQANINFEKALLLFKREDAKKYIGETYWHLGSGNTFLSNMNLANEQLLTALEYSKKLNNKKLEAKINGSFAHIRYLYKDYKGAINFIQKSIEIYTKEQDSVGLSATYNNMAVIYKNTRHLTKAIEYNAKSLEINRLLNDENAIAKSYNNLGLVSELLFQKEQAITFYKKAIATNTKINSSNSSAHRNLADLHFKNKELEEAKKLYLQALAAENKSNRIQIQKKIYNQLVDVSLNQKNYKNSLRYSKKRDSIDRLQIQKENLEKLSFIENQYKAAERENKLQQEISINNKNKIIFGVLTLTLLLLLVFVSQRNKNSQLKLTQEKLELEQSVLRSQMNPHFIFNALTAIQNSLLDNNPIQSASYLSRFAKLIRQNLDFISENSILLSDEIDVLQNYMDTQKMRYQNKFDYEINVFANVDIHAVEIPPLLLQPFVENSIEHGFKNLDKEGLITINISNKKERIHYEIIDNGKGISDSEKAPKLHALDIFKKRLKLLGNNDEDSFTISSSKLGTTIKFCIKKC